MKEAKLNNKRTVKDIITVVRKFGLSSNSDPHSIRLALEELGPTFVKLGQLIATQSSVFPPELCAELRCLRDEVAPMTMEQVDQVIFEAYGKRKEEVFEYFDEDAHGSASISQVHHARLKSGEDVAVKIQRIGARETMEEDIRFLRRVAKMIPFLKKNKLVDVDDVIDELWNITQLELDFVNEAGNLERFYELNKDVKYSTCPLVYPEYTRPTIVVMEYIRGINFNDREALLENGYDLEEIGRKYIRGFLKQAFIDGFFQADPHTGNLKISGGHIVWYDLGMMGSFSKNNKDTMADAIEAMVMGDTVKGYDAVSKIMRLPPKYDKEALYRDLEDFFDAITKAGLEDLDLSLEVQRFMSISRKHKAIVDGTYTMMSRGITVLQGTVEELFPEIDFFEEVKSFAIYMQLSEEHKKDRDLEHIRKRMKMRKLAQIPDNIANMLDLYSRGLVPIRMEMGVNENSHEFIAKITRIIVDALITVALLVSSSILVLAGLKPLVAGVPLLGIIGYSLALIMCIASFIKKILKR